MEKWRKLMESRKFNWNKILSGLIAGVGIALVCIFLGICFLVPVKVSIKALTKSEIDDYNINFVASKTKLKIADNYNLVKLQDSNGTDFYTYQYNYINTATIPNFYSKTNSAQDLIDYSSEALGNVSLNWGNSKLSLYQKYDNSSISSNASALINDNGYFVPTNTTAYENTITDSIEDIFYDEADENDFVMLNNYNSYASNYDNTNGVQPFNVENFYLAFGTPYLDEYTHTTPIHELRVHGILYSNGQMHNLVLNETKMVYMRGVSSGTPSYPAYYWYQYFDLRNLQAYKDGSNDTGDTYAIENQQGKYEITFEFVKYEKDGDGEWQVGTTKETFVYTFYLLDSENYDATPTITNAELGYIDIMSNSTNEYYFNFTNDFPTLTYDPSKFNLNYIRENREINETITSAFSMGTYTLNGKNYPKGILTFTDSNSNNKKQVFILGYYNDEKTMVEYLYLTNTSKTAITLPSTYEEIIRLVNNQTIDFEYKTTQILNSAPITNGTLTTSTTYYTYDYDKYEFSMSTANYDTTTKTEEFIKDISEANKYDSTLKKLSATGDIDVIVHTYTYSTDNINYTNLAQIYNINSENIVTDIKINNSLDATTHNTKLLDKIDFGSTPKLKVDSNNASFEYNLVFDDLGIYTFDYYYNIIVYNSNTYGKDTITNYTKDITNKYSSVSVNNSNISTNTLKISDFAQVYNKETSGGSGTTVTQDLTLNVWGYLNTNNSVTLNGIEYTYNPTTNKLTFNDGGDITINLPDTTGRTAVFGDMQTTATYAINTDSQNQYYLTIYYKIGSLAKTTSTTSYIASKQTRNYIKNSEAKVENIITLENPEHAPISATNIGTSDNWYNINKLFAELLDTNTLYYENSYSTTSTNTNQDQLHVFGSMTYFNKTNPNATVTTSNNDKYKFRQIDSRLKTNYTADITKYVKNNTKGFYSTSGYNIENDLKTIDGTTGLTNIAISQGLDINNIIITDITPIFWKNLSSLLYSNKVSKSYIYRYPNYKITGGQIDYGTGVTDLYTKDTYCSEDGLYEIVVLYKYDNFKCLDSSYNYDNTIFYQVFSFIIDNQSPTIDIKVQDILDADNDGDTEEYIANLDSKYTNRNIQISWDIPTFFQNDVYIDIKRQSYSGVTQFEATYKQGTINSGSYTNTTTSFADVGLRDKKYYVYITGNSNGNYEVTLHYSSRGASTSTEEFVIDKQNIDGMKVLPAVQNSNGTYSVNYDNQYYTAGKQIINYNFTYRYNPKESKAKIYTYWYRIDLVSTANYDEVLAVNTNESAITTTFEVNGSNIDSYSYPNQYIYNYNTDDEILSSNYFTSSSSCIYLFKMVDEAGNECRYVVFYDTTTPRFKLDPEPKDDIINDTTTLTWGDYKAIKIDTPAGFLFDSTGVLNDYNISSDIHNNLEEVLTYINSANTSFNDTRIQSIDGNYYMLLPITEVTINDESMDTIKTTNSTTSMTFSDSNIPNNFYFFPVNPITDTQTEKTINIGDYNNPDKKPITNYTYSTAINSSLDTFNRFVSATGTITNYYGTIGEGEFTYQIYDGQRNKVEGYVWMTLDKTQTRSYGIFDTTTPDDPARAMALSGDTGSYAMSKLYISSLQSTHDSAIPDYTLTYQFYELNNDLYTDLLSNYQIYSVEILTKDSGVTDISIIDNQKFLQLTYVTNSAPYKYLTYYVELTNEDGNDPAKHSYPYDIQGVPGEPDSSGNPQHIYNVNQSSYKIVDEDDADSVRIFSNIINPTPDNTGKTDTVTQEGLYIFKRTYTDKSIDLGYDTRIVYFVYYVDRTGIINVTTLNSISEQLYTNKQDLGFVLGSDYSDESLKKYYDANDLANEQTEKDINATYSSTYNNISNLFTTNKILVQFNVTADKYNFLAFTNKFESNVNTKIEGLGLNTDDLASLKKSVSATLFNTSYYANGLYKIDLTLAKGNVDIINESNTDATKVYNTSAINNYLKGNYINSDNTRANSFNLFLQDNNSNAYNIYLKDNSGYKKKDASGAIVDSNYNPNQLDMSFYIKHNAPTGDAYGKYYGRHNYDENKNPNSSINSSSSIPITEYVDSNGQTQYTYALLEKYLQIGQLEPLSLEYKSETMNSSQGRYVKLYSTNNESLIFTFDITQDDTQAQIDPNNIKIYKGGISDANLIFNRVNGINISTTLVNASRQSTSIFTNIIKGVTKYAIVVFDNNLDEILDDDEQSYSNYRLLDSSQNNDSETYYIQINYVGDKDNYIKEDNNGNKISYHATTYEVTIDRNKPEYNLTKLMALDKYVYNTVSTKPTTSNYENVFDSYKSFYNFIEDSDFKFERSDLENYFFALDYRKDSTFVFESINDLDSSGGIYIRKVSPTNYKFSKTPDDYKSYYEATYLTGNPQFSPNRATILNKADNTKIDSTSYYYLAYGIMSDNPQDKTISVCDIMKFLEVGQYYEIIEQDEAKNYRVYAVYIPDYQNTQIRYEYKENNNADTKIGTLNYNSNPTIPNISGIEFELTNYITSDYFVKAILAINSNSLKETINIFYSPKDTTIYKTTSTNSIREKYENISTGDYKSEFIQVINEQIAKYNEKVSAQNEHGYVINLTIVDRLGVKSTISDTKLFDYEFTYNVAGSVLKPIFAKHASNNNMFTMTIPAMDGTTYIEQVSAYIFQGGWAPKDPDDIGNSFSKSANELKKGTTYSLNKGVYKFVLTDNFKRTNTYFYEFGTSNQSGGILNFSDKYATYLDGYTYTAKSANFVYDNSIYDIYIKFVGEVGDITYADSDTNPHIVYSSTSNASDSDLMQYGIKVAKIDNITTISFTGVSDLTKYHIKTIPASISSEYDYTWGKENGSDDFLVYDNKLAIYTGIESPIIRNANGNILDTSEHLNLSEDFEITTAWTNGYAPEKQLSFDSKIYLVRTYTENNVVMPPEIYSNSNYYKITKPGDYTAYVFNALNNKSYTITFTRGDSEIGIYSVVNVKSKVTTKLSPSTKVTSENYETADENRTLIEFSYFTTIDYFSFLDTTTNATIEPSTLVGSDEDDLFDIANIQINRNAGNYMDIQVKSDLSIFVQLHELKKDGDTPYAKFRIYSKNKQNKDYTYRFVKVYFLDSTDYTLASTLVSNVSSSNLDSNAKKNNIYDSTSVIKRPDKYLYVAFRFKDATNSTKYVDGNTIYVDRYFNGEFVETISYTNISEQTEAKFTLTQVGLHKFVVRDLAGRVQVFGKDTTKANNLQIYLINQILFSVNNATPIDNQIFNDTVTIKIQSQLAGVTLYNTNTIGVKVTRNGEDVSISDATEFSFSESGSYIVKMDATTILADQEISTTYKFVIVKMDIANKSFNISKGTGFEIDKVFKVVNNERTEMTESFKNNEIGEDINSGSLIWLTAKNQGNSIFEISLKYFDQTTKDYQYFTFNVWLNDEQPVIISSINNGSSSKETITLSFNPGIIYTQVGKCKILVNDKEYLSINNEDDKVVQTITITQKGTYTIKIVSDDGTLISSYKYTKNDPISKTTIIVLICVAIGAVVLVVLFLLIRRKGKYR